MVGTTESFNIESAPSSANTNVDDVEPAVDHVAAPIAAFSRTFLRNC
jgi:hypothetical protein